MWKRFWILALVAALAGCAARQAGSWEAQRQARIGALCDSLQRIADGCDGEVGIAVLTDCGDTVLVNNETKYPLMSVFKLHQAMALCSDFERRGLSVDSVVRIARSGLNPDTWSPMLKDHREDTIDMAVRGLMRYALMQSDNNASNYMFEHLQPVAAVDSFTATIAPRCSFCLRHTEADMWSDHALAYENRTSPLGAAIVMDRLFADSIAGAAFIRSTLSECRTGADRIAAPLLGIEGVEVAHKTGSGFRSPDGTLAAHNDVARVSLPDGRCYTLAVFVKDFHGSESEAAAVIARVSAVVYASLE
ncbi:MAG: class A beta-lactamase-related serine hydrolase [Muribaculaceae bacterium]|nr:class A beta-lactamase-related serine hydrolase [Muribaculaceae bacterium]